MLHRIAPVLVLLLPAACVDTGVFVLGEHDFAPRAEDHRIRFFQRADDVPHPFDRVALLVTTASDEASWQRVRESIEREARSVGADAVVLESVGERAVAVDDDGCRRWRRGVSALAIRYR